MKIYFAFAVLLQSVTAIWPIPVSYTHGSDVLFIDKSATVSYTTTLGPTAHFTFHDIDSDSHGSVDSARVVQVAVQRMYNAIFNQNFVPWMFHPRGSDFEPVLKGDSRSISTISLVQTKADSKDLLKPKAGQIDESYSLQMTEDGSVSIKAASSIGLAHGLTTFTQLFFAGSSGTSFYTTFAPVSITDSPKFSHRGLNLDTSRTFKPVPDLKRTIDALAFNKFNRLHWHITDAQSWPLVINSMPSLSSKGAYRPSMIYSPEDVLDLQHYGALRGVEVYIEIDMPGHTSSIAYAYPDLVAAFDVQPDWGTYAAEPPSGTLKLNSSAVYSFLDDIWHELLPRVFPFSSYFHTGGDEVNFNAYLKDNTVRSNKTSVIRPLLQKFTNHNHARVRAAGLTPMVWEEMLLEYKIKLGADVVVQTWQSDEAVLETVKKGHKALAGNFDYWYLDCGKGQWIDFAPGMASQQNWPYLDYCSPVKNWRLMYSYDPLRNIPTHLAHLVLGGETHMWSEQTDAINMDRMMWPRASAAGEVLWSGALDAQGQNRSQITASPRLAEMRERLVARGVMAEPVRMPFCQMEKESCVIF